MMSEQTEQSAQLRALTTTQDQMVPGNSFFDLDGAEHSIQDLTPDLMDMVSSGEIFLDKRGRARVATGSIAVGETVKLGAEDRDKPVQLLVGNGSQIRDPRQAVGMPNVRRWVDDRFPGSPYDKPRSLDMFTASDLVVIVKNHQLLGNEVAAAEYSRRAVRRAYDELEKTFTAVLTEGNSLDFSAVRSSLDVIADLDPQLYGSDAKDLVCVAFIEMSKSPRKQRSLAQAVAAHTLHQNDIPYKLIDEYLPRHQGEIQRFEELLGDPTIDWTTSDARQLASVGITAEL